MKKVSAILLALVIALSMVVFASAADAKEDFNTVLSDLAAVASPEEIKAAVNDALAKAGVDKDVDAADVPAGADNEVAGAIIEKLGLQGTDTADKIQKAMSNDFVSFLAGLYIPTTVKPPEATEVVTPPETGSSPAIAIAAFATVSVAAAAAFICLKKKED
ncbi:MAG: hypothetical protein LBG83_07185 [Oscillospiraceae bacterium]|jgi:hypothetical protein|nr:hypothetical protein [Oscillospiraceae bacterium]